MFSICSLQYWQSENQAMKGINKRYSPMALVRARPPPPRSGISDMISPRWQPKGPRKKSVTVSYFTEQSNEFG